ncbi:cytochrome P450 6k1-like isoform X1 [Oratosquilla oratoria]|uniref:cytochrome P450 6k1-like isoform X1 n=1 Tax=Oratosquilla oratoria TaxID=337810 RepID=UPI003F76E518
MFWTVSLCVTLLAILLGYCHYCHQYWQTMGVFVPPSVPIIGHFHLFFSKKENYHDYLHKLFLKTNAPFIGIYAFLKPQLIIRDISLLKHILIKDFDYFIDRRNLNVTGSVEKLVSEMLVSVSGEKWKALRSIVSPTFTSGKLKGLFPLISEKCQRLSKWCLTEGTLRDKVEMKEVFGRFALDTIANSAFGIESRCIEDEDDEFSKAARQISKSPSFARIMKTALLFLAPPLFRFLKLRVSDSSMDYFEERLKETLQMREKADKRGDFLDLMLDAKKNSEAESKSKYPVTDTTVMAQSVLFLFAGYETTSTTLAFFAYLLARHPEVQGQVREELRNLIDVHGEITYQFITEARLLDACLYESMRIYPAAPSTVRTCTREYTIPGTAITLKKDMLVHVPIWTLNRDPEIWEDPETYRPERFLPENKNPDQTFAFHTFGQGPRNCVGMRFALLEIKLAMAHLLLQMELLEVPGHDRPLELEVKPGVILAKDGINLALRALPRDKIRVPTHEDR